jgi:hypothetical protein
MPVRFRGPGLSAGVVNRNVIQPCYLLVAAWGLLSSR